MSAAHERKVRAVRALANPSGRPLRENTLRIWRVVAGAGTKGVGSSAIYDKFKGVIDPTVISSALQSMIQGKYIERDGVNRYGAWLITARCKTPAGEERPMWLDELPDDDEAIAADAVARSKTEVTMPPAPVSAFSLQPGWRLPFSNGQGVKPKLAKAETVAATPKADSHAVLDWKPPPSAAADDESPIDTAAPVTPSLADGSPRFLASLDSEGELYLYSDGQELLLGVDHTRKLLHYLDHLSATALVDALTGATS